MPPVTSIVTDIEGTTTPITFVRDVLFPYARRRIGEYLHTHGAETEVCNALTQVSSLAPGTSPLDALLAWMDADVKATPLKTLQGLVWREGYETGDLRGQLYPDVAPALRRWHGAGVRLYVYSSGSEAAQRLLFGHSSDGNLADLFSGFFDTRLGGKREAASYRAVADIIGEQPGRILFLSDVGQELDAAGLSGLQTCQLIRPADGTRPAAGHRTAADFTVVTNMLGQSR